MKWIKEVEENEVILNNTNFEEETNDFKIQNYINEKPKEYSVLTEFFLMISSLDNDSLTTFDLKEKYINDKMVTEVIQHFDDRKVLIKEASPVQVMLSKPNIESLEFINSKQLNPVIHSFQKIIEKEQNMDWTPSKPYKLISSYILEYQNEEFDKVIDFLKDTTIESLISINVYNIYLKDDLKDSLFIQYLSSKCKNVYLWIDELSKITLIQLEL